MFGFKRTDNSNPNWWNPFFLIILYISIHPDYWRAYIFNRKCLGVQKTVHTITGQTDPFLIFIQTLFILIVADFHFQAITLKFTKIVHILYSQTSTYIFLIESFLVLIAFECTSSSSEWYIRGSDLSTKNCEPRSVICGWPHLVVAVNFCTVFLKLTVNFT